MISFVIFQRGISCQFFDDAIILDRVVDRVDEKDRIDVVQRPVLPFFNLRKEFVRYIRS